MSIRHVHAKRGEYIAVHRNYCHRGGSGETEGCLSLIAFIVVMYLIFSFWKLIVWGAILIVTVWLIYTFREPIWSAIAALVKWIVRAAAACLQRYRQRRRQKQLPPQADYQIARPAEYGKIIQRR